MHTYFPTDPEFQSMGDQIFSFINRNAADNYSDRTMMAIVRQCDRQDARLIVIDAEAASIDRLTEIKTGGVRAAAIVLRDGRVVMSVRQDLRRQGIGRQLVRHIGRHIALSEFDDTQFQFWCNSRNAAGMAFLNSVHFEIAAVRPNGAICFTPDAADCAWD